ncbi:MAG: ankyrin repeat domain-containing protein [Epsilonproteobacteria bacterium]|nr:ankyrin repeat domain-containing protein [Campylobacterota bacterium]
MKCRLFCLVTVAAVLVSHSLVARPSVRSLKGVDALFKPEYQLLSPSYGCLFAESDIAQTLYRFVSEDFDKPLHDVLHTLFRLDADNINFRVQQSLSGFVSHLKPRHIGMLMGLVVLSRSIPNDIAAIIAEDIGLGLNAHAKDMKEKIDKAKAAVPNSGEIITLLSALGKNNQAALKKYEDLVSKIKNKQQLNRDDKKHKAILSFLTGNDFESIAPDFDWKENINPESRRRIEQIRGLQDENNRVGKAQKTLTSSVLELVKNLRLIDQEKRFPGLDQVSSGVIAASSGVISDQSNVIPAPEPGSILPLVLLNVFLWEKCFSRVDMQAYINGLRSVASDVFSSEEKLDADGQKAQYSLEETVKLKKELFSRISKEGDDALGAEEVMVGFFAQNRLPKPLCYGNAVFEGKSFADCGETSLRNFFNLLFFNDKTQKFDQEKIDKLEKEGFVIDEKIKVFYKSFPDCARGTTPQARNEWAKITSDINGVVYNNKNCEISSRNGGMKNMCRVLRHLIVFPADTPITDSLEDNVILYLWRGQTGDLTGGKVSGYFQGRSEIDFGKGLHWNFYQGHFELIIPAIERIYQASQYIQKCLTGQEQGKYNFVRTLIASFLAKEEAGLTDYVACLEKVTDEQKKRFALCLLEPRYVLRAVCVPFPREASLQAFGQYLANIRDNIDSTWFDRIIALTAELQFLRDADVVKIAQVLAEYSVDFDKYVQTFLPADKLKDFLINDIDYAFKVITFLWTLGNNDKYQEACFDFTSRLISEQRDIMQKRNAKQEGLLHAATRAENIEIIKVLQKFEGVDVNMQDDSGNTPLYAAVSQRNIEIVKVLLGSKGIDVNRQDLSGAAPLHRALLENNIEIAQELLKAEGIDVNKPNKPGDTPLHMAVSERNVKGVQVLRGAKGIEVNKPNKFGVTPLHLAVNREDEEVVQALLNFEGIAVNERDMSGATALLDAVKRGNFAIVNALFAKGADVSLKDKQGKSAIDVARENGFTEIVELLEQAQEKQSESSDQ